MIRPPPRSTLTDPLFPYTTLFRSIASGCLAAIDYGTAFDHMHVAQPPAGQRQPGGFIRVEQASEQPCVLMQAHRAIGAVGAGDQPQPTTFLRLWVSLLLVAGCNPGVLGKNPDLQEMGQDRKSTRLNSSH